MELLRSLGVVVTWGALLATPAAAMTKTFFTSQESVEQEMVRLIDESQSSIDVALFELRSPRLVRALKQAQSRGVQLRLVLDVSHRKDDLPVGQIRWLGGKAPRGRGAMHNKFSLFDQERVVTGSYNWTPGAEHMNYENALLTDDPETVSAYAKEFERLWSRATERPSRRASQHRTKSGKIKRAKAVIIRGFKALTNRP